MHRVRVKICGITRPGDGIVAAQAGADAIGLVFYPGSSRLVDTATALAIVQALPPFVTSVGLFLDASAAQVRAVLERVPLDLLQFHGTETAALCEQFERPYSKAVPMRFEADVQAYLSVIASRKGVGLSELANDLLKKEIQILEFVRS